MSFVSLSTLHSLFSVTGINTDVLADCKAGEVRTSLLGIIANKITRLENQRKTTVNQNETDHEELVSLTMEVLDSEKELSRAILERDELYAKYQAANRKVSSLQNDLETKRNQADEIRTKVKVRTREIPGLLEKEAILKEAHAKWADNDWKPLDPANNPDPEYYQVFITACTEATTLAEFSQVHDEDIVNKTVELCKDFGAKGIGDKDDEFAIIRMKLAAKAWPDYIKIESEDSPETKDKRAAEVMQEGCNEALSRAAKKRRLNPEVATPVGAVAGGGTVDTPFRATEEAAENATEKSNVDNPTSTGNAS